MNSRESYRVIERAATRRRVRVSPNHYVFTSAHPRSQWPSLNSVSLMPKMIPRGVFMMLLFAVTSASAQESSGSDSPKLSEHFTFRLSRYRERAVQELTETITRQSDSQHVVELREANQTVVDRLLGLARFGPFKLRSSDINSDGFLTPNYLRLDYDRPPQDSHFFDSR